MKNWHRNKKLTPSMMRSRIKKQYAGRLPSRIMVDPFVGRMYYNKNGRAIILGWSLKHKNNFNSGVKV